MVVLPRKSFQYLMCLIVSNQLFSLHYGWTFCARYNQFETLSVYLNEFFFFKFTYTEFRPKGVWYNESAPELERLS